MTVLENFVHMGGYAFYVWSSYLLAFVVLLANIVAPLRRKSEVLKQIARMRRRAGRSP